MGNDQLFSSFQIVHFHTLGKIKFNRINLIFCKSPHFPNMHMNWFAALISTEKENKS
jgi:hypothetical protein